MLLFTPLTTKELRKLNDQYEVISILGLQIKGQIVKPPVCPLCGNLLYVDFVEGVPDISQCFNCGDIRRLYYTDVYTLRRGWDTLNGKGKHSD